MRFGIQVPLFDAPGGATGIGPARRDIARRADDASLASLWVTDHFFQIEMVGPAEMDMLEGYPALAFATATERIRLAAMVTGVTYRHPGILLKTVTTLDVLSGGRAWLGIGAGWFEREHRGLGVPFPPMADRFEPLEETPRIAKQMWAADASPFHGAHDRLEEPINHPQPISNPHPPILVGDSEERKTPRLAAATPTPATSSRGASTPCVTSWTYRAVTARPKGATTPRSKRPCSGRRSLRQDAAGAG